MVERGDIYWINLDPTIGSEIKKTRPALIISNNMQNKLGLRFVVAPITSVTKNIYPFESKIIVGDKSCKVMCDQVRTVDRRRLSHYICSARMDEIFEAEKALRIVLALG